MYAKITAKVEEEMRKSPLPTVIETPTQEQPPTSLLDLSIEYVVQFINTIVALLKKVTKYILVRA